MSEEVKEEQVSENAKLLYAQVESYFQFKKNLLIQEVTFFNRDVLETPDIICILAAECIYNAHTGRLIITGGSSDGFYKEVKARYSIDSKMNTRLLVLVDAIIAAKNNDFVEFIPEGKSLQDHLSQMLNESDQKVDKILEVINEKSNSTVN